MSLDRSPFTVPSFEQKTTEKLAHYYIKGTNYLDKINLRFNKSVAAVTPHWKRAEQTWRANPDNPNAFPNCALTVGSMLAFYAKCDSFFEPEPTSIEGMIHAVFAAFAGAEYIVTFLSKSKSTASCGRISQNAGKICIETCYPPEEIRAATGGNRPIPPATVSPGDVLQYRDSDKKVQTIRIKDHGSSAMKGEYFIVTNNIDELDEDDDGEGDDSGDYEVPSDVMAEWVTRRIMIR